MEYSSVNLRKIEKIACFALKNGIRLHLDSILLFKNKSFPSAYFISILALEEIGKFFLLEDFLFHSTGEGQMNKKNEEDLIESIYVHRSKQHSFVNNLVSPFSVSSFTKDIFNGNMEIKKQNAVYVGLPRNKRKINLKGRINNPVNISKLKVSNQITEINDKIIEHVLGVVKTIYCTETECAEKILNKNLYNQLRKKWPIIKSKTKRRLQKMEQV